MMPSIVLPPTEETIFPDMLGPEYVGFDHVSWYVGNAKQAASFYVTRMGFKHVAYRGPETGSRSVASYVVRNGTAVFVLTSPVRSCTDDVPDEEAALLRDIHEHLAKHGDGVKDVAFQIDGDVHAAWRRAVDHGAVSVCSPKILKDDDATHDVDHGQVYFATVGAYGDTVHSLVNRRGYSGVFLPGYHPITEEDPIDKFLPAVDFIEIDHCVGNQPWKGLDDAVK
jgi:4-hydroxyphenylpyruvate dioxygenase